jgi:hypothetical protein
VSLTGVSIEDQMVTSVVQQHNPVTTDHTFGIVVYLAFTQVRQAPLNKPPPHPKGGVRLCLGGHPPFRPDVFINLRGHIKTPVVAEGYTGGCFKRVTV